jgi:hypothetical protein
MSAPMTAKGYAARIDDGMSKRECILALPGILADFIVETDAAVDARRPGESMRAVCEAMERKWAEFARLVSKFLCVRSDGYAHGIKTRRPEVYAAWKGDGA